MIMRQEVYSPNEIKGQQIISLLREPRYLEGVVLENERDSMSLTDENHKPIAWSAFVTFPPELSRAFPGSVMLPGTFLNALNNDCMRADNLLDGERKKGEVVFKHTDPHGRFQLSVLHGSTSKYALELMTLARRGFDDESVRAQYQHAMSEGIAPALKDTHIPTYGVRIHDDCLASGDSILSYLELQMQLGNEEILKKGVEVVITAAATAQAILLLRAYADKHQLPLRMTVGYMAYGLSEGITAKDGTRKHANYLTMPHEVIQHLSLDKREQVMDVAKDSSVYVVGDMGDAEKGVSWRTIKMLEIETGNPTYCAVNNIRGDGHGDHPQKGTLHRMDGPIRKDVPNDVYFARGGYVPYAIDDMYRMHFKTNKVILIASRKWSKEFGYGAAFRPTD